jgi:hypothetical protein
MSAFAALCTVDNRVVPAAAEALAKGISTKETLFMYDAVWAAAGAFAKAAFSSTPEVSPDDGVSVYQPDRAQAIPMLLESVVFAGASGLLDIDRSRFRTSAGLANDIVNIVYNFDTRAYEMHNVGSVESYSSNTEEINVSLNEPPTQPLLSWSDFSFYPNVCSQWSE